MKQALVLALLTLSPAALAAPDMIARKGGTSSVGPLVAAAFRPFPGRNQGNCALELTCGNLEIGFVSAGGNPLMQPHHVECATRELVTEVDAGNETLVQAPGFTITFSDEAYHSAGQYFSANLTQSGSAQTVECLKGPRF